MNQSRLIVIDNEPDLAGFVCDVAELADFDTGPFNRQKPSQWRNDPCCHML